MAAWAILGALLAAVYAFIAAPLTDLYRVRAQDLSDKRRLLTRYRALAAAIQQAPRPPGPNGGEPAPEGPILLPGANDAAAAAALELAVKELLDRSHTVATSTEAVPAQAIGTLKQIGVRVVFSARLDRLTGFLRAVGHQRPSLIIDTLTIDAAPAEASEQPDVAVSLGISGFKDAAQSSSTAPP
jgi:hypothetical protein